MEENNANPENKKNYLAIIVFGILILIPIIFGIFMLTGNEKNEETQTQDVIVSPEAQLAQAMKTIETDSSETALFNYGLALINNKMYKKGVDVYLKVIKLNPKNTRVINNLGFAYGCIGDWDNGIKYCQMALNIDPSFQLAKNNLKWVLDEKSKTGTK